ncbi:hypothetical protein FDI80_gp33 [Streptomyces phage Aaronocolus]|uniref:Uncharacterized protein n=11 Tax=Likavirus TaxID=1982880 RepID=A0A411CVP7_9CAUD|nr:hypothetical protein AVT22_gp33 [Streptomyces phage Caliburn]YP_009616458.1 hypothetical protein FDI80_gp33 [Streptomyces phage Aaronocolus]YP_009616533.1 hypothetical protein FDI81_gp35 [Streptomyces phage Hydra]ATE84912.1 hypothetical protein SEA_BEARDEDLADY_34 [Streptomyces phage BeardedLady]ATE85213.1 hypothetical protein SEA_ESPERER_33 [Streptomyces phage Esperer]ATE85438.1 hypothetical protein SEA_OZZIE_33 [Streptomyces phage Ozzie]QAY17236.1 hypothetical protein SEA_BOVELY_33 [Strep
MALNFIDIPQQGGGWFKPKDNKDAVAILLEVHSFDRQRPTPNGPKDSALADVTIFKTMEELEAGTPSSIAKGQRIEQTVLARDLEAIVGGATIVTLDQIPAKKPGAYPAWVWRQADGGVKAKIVAYATKREAEVNAAMADVPDFD